MLSVRVGASWNGGSPIGGTWLHGLVSFGGLSFDTSLQRCADNSGGGGLLTVSWEMALPANRPLPMQVRQGSLVELFAGSAPLGAAVIAETPRGTTVAADGLFRLGEHFMAVDSLGNPTTSVAVAVSSAITRGLWWRNPGDLPSGSVSALPEGTAQFNSISALLNQYCRINGKMWRIDRNRYLRVIDRPDAAAPTLALSPLVPNPQTADDDFVSTYFIRRVSAVGADGQPSAWAANSASDPGGPMVREAADDLSSLGLMSSVGGAASAQALLDANKSRASFAEGVQVARGQVTTPGGTPPELWAVAAGDVVQQPNWMTASGDFVWGDRRSWVVGGTRWRQGEPLTMTPLGIAPRSVAQIVQGRGRRGLVFS